MVARFLQVIQLSFQRDVNISFEHLRIIVQFAHIA